MGRRKPTKPSDTDTSPAQRAQQRDTEIQEALDAVREAFGQTAVGTARGKHSVRAPDVEAISTGVLGLDRALGPRGLPRGRVVEVYGSQGGGKTTLALQTIANAQRQGWLAAFVDAEHALDLDYAEALGVNADELLLAQPDSGEEALNIVRSLAKTGKVAVIVVDSVAALVPMQEVDNDIGDVTVGAQARMMSGALRVLTPVVAGSKTLLVFINQVRQKIGVKFGNPNTTAGGTALQFYASVRLQVTRIGSVKRGAELVGNRVKIETKKNKLAPPFRTIEADLMFGKGFDRSAELLDTGIALGVLKKAGSYFKYGDRSLGQGRAVACHALKQDDALVQAIEDAFWNQSDG